jgi:exopolyphosphatase/guanosine-5'-triphosphate,3'-diphosphate pyrophosphatase
MIETDVRQEFLGFMNELETEPEHVLHVAKLSLLLFDQLRELHGIEGEDRLILEAAACLHDIGWSITPGGEEHHKASARLIRERVWKSLDKRAVDLVALVARYHRRSLPDLEHKDYLVLSPEDRHRIDQLAAFLRMGDGLDRRHLQYVIDVQSSIQSDKVTIHLLTREFADREIEAAKKKSDLAVLVFHREFVFTAELV